MAPSTSKVADFGLRRSLGVGAKESTKAERPWRRSGASREPPVAAMPIMSRPLSATGSATHWMGVGVSYPCDHIASYGYL